MSGTGLLGRTLPRLQQGVRTLEDWYFDTRWGVDTAGDPVPHRAVDLVGMQRDGHVYLPARTRSIEQALRHLPLQDAGSFTFIDLGSGKGRVVLLAATKPFRRVIGVEYSQALHHQAEQNLKRFKGGDVARARIELVLADAATFAFPPGDLVIHLFNPFGPEVMACVLENLHKAIQEQPRRVFVVMLWPELSHMVESSPAMKLYHRDRRCDIFVAER